MTELIWDGKYKDGKKQGPVRIALPFQTIETVNESAQERQRSPIAGSFSTSITPHPSRAKPGCTARKPSAWCMWARWMPR